MLPGGAFSSRDMLTQALGCGGEERATRGRTVGAGIAGREGKDVMDAASAVVGVAGKKLRGVGVPPAEVGERRRGDGPDGFSGLWKPDIPDPAAEKGVWLW